MTANERLLRAVLMRFVPGCGLALTSVVGGIWLVAPNQVTWLMIARVLAELLGLTAGFATVLGIRGPRLARVRGLGVRSFAAGLLAPIGAGACSWLYPNAGLVGIALLSAVAGAAAVIAVTPRLLRFRVRLLGPTPDPQEQY